MDIDKHKNKFGTQAENYTKYRLPYIPELSQTLFSLLAQKKGKILDVACGTGKSTEFLVSDNFEVYALDHDPLMIEEAKKQAKLKNLSIEYKIGLVEDLPYKDEEFEAVTVGTAFHWFANEKALSEMKRVLKPGGLLFIFWTLTTKDVPEEDSIPREIFQKYNWEKVPSELRDLDYISDLLRKNDFKSVETKRLPFSYNTTVGEIVGLMKTASSYEVLSEEDKESFIQDISEALTKNLGSREYFRYEEEIQVVYGFKN